MTNYELMFIINPTLEEEKKNTVVEMVQGIITDNGGEVSNVDVWGMRKLAYLIEFVPCHQQIRSYVVIEFKAGTDLPKELDRRLRISDNVMRHMIINKDAK